MALNAPTPLPPHSSPDPPPPAGTRGLLFPSPPPVPLTPEFIADIHRVGGSVIGSARGGHDQVQYYDKQY
jgi:hypothetical protein